MSPHVLTFGSAMQIIEFQILIIDHVKLIKTIYV